MFAEGEGMLHEEAHSNCLYAAWIRSSKVKITLIFVELQKLAGIQFL